jgi:hypothetical protein
MPDVVCVCSKCERLSWFTDEGEKHPGRLISSKARRNHVLSDTREMQRPKIESTPEPSAGPSAKVSTSNTRERRKEAEYNSKLLQTGAFYVLWLRISKLMLMISFGSCYHTLLFAHCMALPS